MSKRKGNVVQGMNPRTLHAFKLLDDALSATGKTGGMSEVITIKGHRITGHKLVESTLPKNGIVDDLQGEELKTVRVLFKRLKDKDDGTRRYNVYLTHRMSNWTKRVQEDKVQAVDRRDGAGATSDNSETFNVLLK